ncbi:MAG: hydroxyacid dehydrogenase [Betaproteobacteria bacterium]|nr:hydroxyacid dehydrogenase [Betaproteobacteria bacterium]
METKPVLLVTAADLAPQALALLGAFRIVFAGKTPQPDEVVALCREYNPVAIIVRYGKVTAAMMDAAPALQVISKHGSGIDTIDLAAAKARGIEVKAAAGANAAAVAEHAIALLLACAKSVVQMNQRMHAGHWDKATHKSVELSGRTLGLIGLGAIGRRVAVVADAMGMKVIGFDPFATNLPSCIRQADLETIWCEADAISLHCPLTEDNRNVINASTLAQMKRGVMLINTARGGLIDEPALLAAVKSGQVASAGLDSFAIEPPPADHPFFGVPNITLSPHIGGVTGDAYINMGIGAANNVLSVVTTNSITQ